MHWFPLSLFVLFPFISFSQSLPFSVRHYTVADGLSNDWISDIEQDENGYLWIGTQYGLNRFDGREFEIFTYRPGSPQGLAANWIRRITVRKDSLFLAPLGQGLQSLHGHSRQFSPPWGQQGIGLLNLRDMLVLQDSLILVAASSGVWQVSKHTTQQMAAGSYQDLLQWKNGWLAAGTDGLIYYHDGQIDSLQKDKPVNSIVRLNDSTVLQLSVQNTYQTTLTTTGPKTIEVTHRWGRYSQSPRYEPSFSSPENGDLCWLPLYGGIVGLDRSGQIVHQISTPELSREVGLSGEVSLHAFFQDREGHYWLGTDRGLFQLSPRQGFRQGPLKSITNPFARCREVGVRGDTLWMAMPSGLFRLLPGEEEPQQIVTGRFHSFAFAPNGMLYIFDRRPDQSRLLRISTNNLQSTELACLEGFQGAPDNWAMAFDARGHLWLSLWNKILHYDPSTDACRLVEVEGHSNDLSLIDLIIDSEDRLWTAGITSSLIRIDNISQQNKDQLRPSKIYTYEKDDPYSLSNPLCQTLHQSQDGTIWVATDGGFNRLRADEQGFDRFLRNDRLPDDKVLAMQSDAAGRLWLSTISHGIISFNPKLGSYRVYGKEAGLYGEAMLLSSSAQDEKGFIYFGGQEGLQAFHPDSLEASNTNKTPQIIWDWGRLYGPKDDSLFYGPYPYAQNFSRLKEESPNKASAPVFAIPSRFSSIQFGFSLPTFERPDDWRYRFKLTGFHDDWLPWQSDGELLLSQLPKGRYQLLVEAADRAGNTTVKHIAIGLRVLPPWYQTTLAYIIYGLFIVALAFGGYRLQLRRRLAEADRVRTEQESSERLKWFNHIAHEFRTPLTVIVGALDRIRHGKSSDSESEQLEQIERQTSHLRLQVDQIMDLAALRYKHSQLNEEEGDLISYLRYLLSGFNSLAEQKQIKLEFHTEIETLTQSFDHEVWRKIIGNLLSNAYKYCPAGSRIRLSIQQEGMEELHIQVSDNGPGIDPSFQKQIFEPFSRERPEQQEGSGLGLTLVQELVQQIGGQIKLESELGIGSNFLIDVPINLLVETRTKTPPATDDQPLLFIAEDQIEIIDYLKYCLADHYQIATATNGLNAWNSCHQQPPDLLISDIMMPGIDGLELCRRMKTNLATDHVPVVILTAKGGRQSLHEGLNVGADAYLAKPFDREELLIRIQGLIKGRERLRRKYAKADFVASPKKSMDAFVQNTYQTINSKLHLPEFGILELAEELHLSRTQLFRKLKHLTGHSPTELLRDARLARADELLALGSLRVNEVAYQCGFADPAYFSRVYRQHRGKAPSDSR